MTIYTKSERETRELGQRLAKHVRPGMVLALYGDLGAGKTALVRGLAAGMGLKARVTSPTFTIVNEYQGEIPLFHFDMYRLTGSEELFEIGWEDYLSRGGVLAVEWSENVEDALDGSVVRIRLERGGSENERRVEIENLPGFGGGEDEDTGN
ncbi:MAG TPA: tRNA (adenosine(37)-N6)-threonylcarbamoyltransferase complex ATPase subunit type 1 TsaE [Clostridiales bacterium]|jgi:tRNA threonylcarbamoyladenosine biosynthesis protein TsaE|nr:tRNA (adenosine(37)-N6)-threonylcarbamoyltransferase complex ATPase subunit type 1 TsaE [Clostridiales bacterium]